MKFFTSSYSGEKAEMSIIGASYDYGDLLMSSPWFLEVEGFHPLKLLGSLALVWKFISNDSSILEVSIGTLPC